MLKGVRKFFLTSLASLYNVFRLFIRKTYKPILYIFYLSGDNCLIRLRELSLPP